MSESLEGLQACRQHDVPKDLQTNVGDGESWPTKPEHPHGFEDFAGQVPESAQTIPRQGEG